MTISTTTNRISYNGNGVTTEFAFPYPFFQNSDLVVQLVNATTGVAVTLVLNTDYTLTGANTENSGQVTTTVPPATGTQLIIVRRVPATQETDYISGDPFPADSHERGLDKLTVLVQQAQDAVDRAIRVPDSDASFPTPLPAVQDRAEKLLRFDTAGNPVASSLGSIGGTVTDASLVEYLPAGTGAIATNVQTKLREFVSVIDYGADPTGVTDSTTAINNAIAHGVASGKTVFIPSGTYLFDGYTNTGQAVSVSIEGEAASWPRLVKSQAAADAGGYMFFITSTRYSTVSGLSLAVNVKPNQQKISLTSVAGLTVGMVLQISSDRLWYNGNRGTKYCGETHKITDIDTVGNIVTIEDFTRDVYTIGTDTLTIRAWAPNKVSIKNLEIVAPKPATVVTSVGIGLQQCDGSIVENVTLKGFQNTSILDNLGWKPVYRNVRFTQDNSFDTTTNGYGISTNGSVGLLADGLYSKGLRRAFDADSIDGTTLAAVCRDWRVTNFQVVGGGAWYPATAEISYGIGSHGPSENGVISNGFIQDCRNGVTARGRNTTVDGVTFSGSMFECVSLHENGAGLVVTNCVYDSFNYPNKFSDLADVVAGSGTQKFIQLGLTSGGISANCFYDLPIVVSNNLVKGITGSFIQVSQDTINPQNLHVFDNVIEGTPGSAGTCYFLNSIGVALNLNNSVFDNNKLTAINGTAVLYGGTSIRLGHMVANGDTVRVLIDGVYHVRIADDNVAKIPLRNRPNIRTVVLANAAAGGTGLFLINVNNATLNVVGTGTALKPATWVGSTAGASLTGTTGVDGNVTFGLENDGNLYIENRNGGTLVLSFTVLN